MHWPYSAPRAGRRWFGAHLRILFTLALLLPVLLPVAAHAQAMPTASRIGDLQLGGGVALGTSTYNFTTSNITGFTAYASFDFRKHWGGEFDFRHNKLSADSTEYEQTYEIGPRYYFRYQRYVPYAKVMYGRGLYNFHDSIANIAYNVVTAGGGVDINVLRSLNVRGDYEYQSWFGFPLGTHHPSVFTIGVAYHFHE